MRTMVNENRRTLVLGASGFVGQELTSKIELSSDLICPSRSNYSNIESEFWNFLKDESELTVINLLGNASMNNLNESTLVNFTLPKKVLDSLQNRRIHWIQASSYFKLYKKIYGSDMNFYSKEKDRFSEYLFNRASADSLRVTDLIFPHIIGPTEKNQRFFKSLASHLVRKEVFYASNCKQILPILSIKKLIEFLTIYLTQSYQECPEHQMLKLPCEYLGSLMGAVTSFREGFPGTSNVVYDSSLNREKEFYELDWLKVRKYRSDFLAQVGVEYYNFLTNLEKGK